MIRVPAGFGGEDRIKRYLDYYQPSYGVMMLSAGQFSPALLFAAGEQGAWYDPSDFTTMFQDSAGATPVTAVEQPVGRILDKSGRGNTATQATSASRPVLSARVNLLTHTEDFSNALWVKQNCTASAMNVADPIGGNTASTITALTSLAFFFYNASPNNPINQTLTSSVWLRRRTGSGNVLLRNNAGGASTILNVTSSWQFFSISCVAAAIGTFNNFVINIDAAGTAIDVWHPDLRNITDGVVLPTYQRVNTSTDYDTTGFPYYLRFDGTDDSLATSTFTPGTDKVQVFSGVRKLSDAATSVVAELTASIAANNGAFLLSAPNSAAANYNFSSKGTTQVNNTVATYTSPITNVVTGLADIIAPSNITRVNASQVGSVGTTQGTGNFAAAALNIGRRDGTTLPLNGRIYSLIIRFGANLDATTISNTETWVNGKTMAY